MGKHTGGKWNVAGCEIFSADNDKMIARVFSGADSNVLLSGAVSARESDCNAALIASAPELLAALEAMIEQYTIAMNGIGLKGHFIDSNSEVIKARAAIARARGQ